MKPRESNARREKKSFSDPRLLKKYEPFNKD